MADNPGSSEHAESEQDQAVITGRSVFRSLRLQTEARAEARRYFRARRRAAIQRQLVMRMLNHRRNPPGLYVIK